MSSHAGSSPLPPGGSSPLPPAEDGGAIEVERPVSRSGLVSRAGLVSLGPHRLLAAGSAYTTDEFRLAASSGCWDVPLPRLREARDEMTRSVHTVGQENVSATLTIAVPAARVFAVLADPATHSAIDGTGWVQEAADQAPLTEVGQIFRVDMYHPGHPDGNYQMANKVQVLDPPRAIGWLPGTEKDDGHLEFGGWIWRYDLAPLGPVETEVTLTYDWSAVPQFIREYLQFPPFGPEHLTNSLHHLAELAAPASPA